MLYKSGCRGEDACGSSVSRRSSCEAL